MLESSSHLVGVGVGVQFYSLKEQFFPRPYWWQNFIEIEQILLVAMLLLGIHYKSLKAQYLAINGVLFIYLFIYLIIFMFTRHRILWWKNFIKAPKRDRR